jgi:deferrochelatase/peroxidase EfeB
VARLAWLFAAVAAVLLATPGAAAAHSVGGVGPTNFRTTLVSVAPAVPGIELLVVENGSQLQLRNSTSTPVVVDGYSGEPYARIGPDGVYLNENSPATYLNSSRYATEVPAGIDASRAPVWHKETGGAVWAWHDHRTHWMLNTLPPAVGATPGVFHHISGWMVTLEYGGQPIIATGSLDWVPGPSAWPWLLLTALIAAGVAALALLRRPHAALAAALGLLVATDVLHSIAIALVTTGTLPARLGALFGSDATSLLVWPFAVVTAWLLWKGHNRPAWLAAGLGLLLGSAMLLNDAPAWWRSSAPTALSPGLNRVTVAIVIGIGLGLVLALPLFWRRFRPPSRPWGTGWSVPAGALEPTTAPPEPVDEPVAVDEPATDGAERDGVGRRQLAGYLAAGAAGAVAGATIMAAASSGASSPAAPVTSGPGLGDVGARTVNFFGDHQAGITAPSRPQAHAVVAAFDLLHATAQADLISLLKKWTTAAQRLSSGQPLRGTDDEVIAGLGPSALTVTIGFGPSLFGKAGVPAAARPDALAPLPAFPFDQLDAASSDGDLGLVIAADDPVVVQHAARVLGRMAVPFATRRWQLTGFNAARGAGSDTATGRNLMGQVDGTNNPKPTEPDFDSKIFAAGTGAQAWLHGGSYLVVRRIRMLLDDWDILSPAQQEQVIGRRRDNGAPLSGGTEFTPANYGARTPDGKLAIPDNAHIRLATPAFNAGAAMLRRGFSYTDGDASGLLFLAWQADPRTGFIPVQRRLSGGDALRTFIRHETSALFVMPGGVAAGGGYVGQKLLEA